MWAVKNEILYNEFNDPLAVIADGCSDENQRIMEIAPELIVSVTKFVDDINSGSFKPKTAVKEFERILNIFNR